MAKFKMVTGYTGTNDRTPSDDAAVWSSIFGNVEGVLPYGNKLLAVLSSANTVTIMDGVLMMQGKEMRITTGDTLEATIDNGESGLNRIDIIAARYTLANNVESCELVTIKGTPTAGTPTPPTPTAGDIESGAVLNEMALYSVTLTGITVGDPVQMFNVLDIGIKSETAVIKASNATSDSSYTDYPYRIDLPVAGCTEDYIPDIYPQADIADVSFSRKVRTTAGIVSVWASNNSFADVSVVIKLTKEV